MIFTRQGIRDPTCHSTAHNVGHWCLKPFFLSRHRKKSTLWPVLDYVHLISSSVHPNHQNSFIYT